jgi:hypothetical protein
MAEKDDQDWRASLADLTSQGESGEQSKAASSGMPREKPAEAAATDARHEDDQEDEIIARARRNGLLIDTSSFEGDPFARRTNWRSALQASARGWVAACIAVGVLFVGWQFRTPLSQQVAHSTPGAVTRLVAPDPRVLKQQIVDELRSTGVEALGYDRLGLSGVDAQLPEPVPAPVLAVLEKYGIPLPTDGVMRLEVVAPTGK